MVRISKFHQMFTKPYLILCCSVCFIVLGCKDIGRQEEKKMISMTPAGMAWIPGGEFQQGAIASDHMALAHEKPAHKVFLNGFFMDTHEVTNGQFHKFVTETGYITTAERKIDWEELKRQLPPGTPRPHDSIMQPGSLIFKKAHTPLPNLYDFSQWWFWEIGANWRHPNGPGSTIDGKAAYPVVHISFEDAMAYCKWAGRRLPTEAEWEFAARGGMHGKIHIWGNGIDSLSMMANTWEGDFPLANTQKDGYERAAPVGMYPANNYGLYDMAGNVWEWTSDWYNPKYYKELKQLNTMPVDPKGANTPFTPNNPHAKERIIKGGSFLCNASYCASYRISSKMASSMDSSMEHLGFRTVATPEMLDKSK